MLEGHSRVAYAEIHDDEQAVTTIGVATRAVVWFAARGVVVERVLSDNGSAYRSHAWRDACAELAVVHQQTRPSRPQADGKIERVHCTMTAGRALRRLYLSETQRRKAPPGWLHEYTTGPTAPSAGKPRSPN